MDSHAHPWVDASKTSSNSVFKVLQKRQLGLPVKCSVRDLAYDDVTRDMGYSHPSFSKDLRLLKELKARSLNYLQTSGVSNYVNYLQLSNFFKSERDHMG